MAAVLIILLVLALFLVVSIAMAVYTVEQQTAAVVQRLGKFILVASPGLHFKIPWVDQIAGRVNLRIRQLDVDVESKTKDNVFVRATVSVQFRVPEEHVYDAFYRLNRPEEQITAYVFDVVRAEVPRLTLDDVFERKEDIANAVQNNLQDVMADFGYFIVNALVTDIDPDASVKTAMNTIQAQERLRLAAEHEAEANKIRVVKAAEGDAQSKALQGQGIADMRRAIAKGLRESVEEVQAGVPGATPEDVMAVLMLTQHYDMVERVGTQSKNTVLMLPFEPGSMSSLRNQIVQATLAGDAIADGDSDNN